jgi:hypothetical protein
MVFNAARTSVAVTNLTLRDPVSNSTVPLSLPSGGSGTYVAATGYMRIDGVLLFHVPWPFANSTLPLLLTTNAPGSVVDAAGKVRLAGTGTFQGGFLNPLNGMTADVTLTGQITPHPDESK